MSIEAVAWALKQKTGSPALKGVLVAIANYSDDDGKCWPSQQTLATLTELGERTVRRSLVELEEMGFLTRKDRFREGRRMSDLFILNFNREGPPVASQAGGVLEKSAATDDSTTGQGRQKPAATQADKPSSEPSENHHLPRANARKKVLIDEFRVDQEAEAIAKKAGLTDADIDALEIKFRAYNAATAPQTQGQWLVHWMTWCGKLAARRRPPSETPASAALLASKAWVVEGTPEWDAIKAKRNGRMPAPSFCKGQTGLGWWFDVEPNP